MTSSSDMTITVPSNGYRTTLLRSEAGFREFELIPCRSSRSLFTTTRRAALVSSRLVLLPCLPDKLLFYPWLEFCCGEYIKPRRARFVDKRERYGRKLLPRHENTVSGSLRMSRLHARSAVTAAVDIPSHDVHRCASAQRADRMKLVSISRKSDGITAKHAPFLTLSGAASGLSRTTTTVSWGEREEERKGGREAITRRNKCAGTKSSGRRDQYWFSLRDAGNNFDSQASRRGSRRDHRSATSGFVGRGYVYWSLSSDII